MFVSRKKYIQLQVYCGEIQETHKRTMGAIMDRVSEVKEDCDKLLKECNRLTGELKDSHEELEMTKSDLAVAQDDLNHAQREIGHLQEDNQNKRAELVELHLCVDQQYDEIERLRRGDD